MVLELALVAEIQATNPKIPETTAQTYAAWVLEEATTRNLDPWVFHAIVRRETLWTPHLIRHERNGTCSVGLGQINVRCKEPMMEPLKDPRHNLQRMGEMLSVMRATCRRECRNLGWLRAYNPKSPAYLAAIQRSVKYNHARHPQPAVCAVRPEVHAPRMPRSSDCRAGRERGLDAWGYDCRRPHAS